MATEDTLLNALIGAVISVVLSFTVFSPILGGGVAGYLQRGTRMDGARVGALSGAIAVIPLVLLLFFVFGTFLFSIPMTGAHTGAAPGGFFILFSLFVFGFGLAWVLALSTLGGYLGAYLATETDIGR